jgi:hypothetical protein
MQVTFHSPDDDSELNVGSEMAARLLCAMGCSHNGQPGGGSMPLSEVREGIEKAKAVLSRDDLEYLGYLEEIVEDIAQTGGDSLRWS